MSTGAPFERGVTVRQATTALLCIDSVDGNSFDVNGVRRSTRTPADIYINKQQTLMFGYMTGITLTEANFQWDIENVNPINNTLTIQEFDAAGVSLGFRRITFGRSFRTMPELALLIEGAMNNIILSQYSVQGGPFIGTYTLQVGGQAISNNLAFANSSVTINQPRLQINRLDGGFFKVVPFDAPANITGFPALKDDLTKMLGIVPTSEVGGVDTPVTFLFGSYASMQYTPYIDIVSQLLTKNQNVSDNSSAKRSTGSKLARIYLANEQIVPREIVMSFNVGGNLVTSFDNAIGVTSFAFRKEFQTPKQIQWNFTENIDVVDLQVLDSRGNTLPIDPDAQVIIQIPGPGIIPEARSKRIQNNADFQFTLQVTEV